MLAAVPVARAERPSYGTEELVHDGELGHVRVHYVTTTDDAVPSDDADEDGTPDYVQEVAETVETAWEDLLARGFRPPLSDAGIVPDDDGDGRFDIYLRNLVAADGNFAAEVCTGDPVHCAGFFAMENDLAGFGYASRSEGISVLTSHELFHAVQHAYAPDTAFAWSEGTAVWNEEQTYPEQGDYERLVAYFLDRPQRPFERSGGGFGDLYPYGTALWPTFLDERYGDGVVRRAWEACEELGPGADFLQAIGVVLGEDGVSIEEAWTAFSRWNLFTAERADAARAYEAGADLSGVALEEGLSAPGRAETTVEGMSARYVPIVLPAAPAEPLRVTVEVDDGAVAAFFPQDAAGAVGAEIELAREGALLAAPLPEVGRGFLVLTGVRRGGLPRDASVEVAVAPPDDGGDGGDDEDSGCQAARSGSGVVPGTVMLLLAAAALSRRRPCRHHRPGRTQ